MVLKIDKCGRCGKEVYLTERKVAINKTWHENCFCCVQCSKKLNSENFITYKGELFCKNCYPESKNYEMDSRKHSDPRTDSEIEDNRNIRPSDIKQLIKKRRKFIKGYSSDDSMTMSPKSGENGPKIARKSNQPDYEDHPSPKRQHSSEDSAYDTGHKPFNLQKICAKFKPNIACSNCKCPEIKRPNTSYSKKRSVSPDFQNNRKPGSANSPRVMQPRNSDVIYDHSVILNKKKGIHNLLDKYKNEKSKTKSPNHKENKEKSFNHKAENKEKSPRKSENTPKEEILFSSESGNVKIVKITNHKTNEKDVTTDKLNYVNNSSDETLYRSLIHNKLSISNKDKNSRPNTAKHLSPREGSLHDFTLRNSSRKSERNSKQEKKREKTKSIERKEKNEHRKSTKNSIQNDDYDIYNLNSKERSSLMKRSISKNNRHSSLIDKIEDNDTVANKIRQSLNEVKIKHLLSSKQEEKCNIAFCRACNEETEDNCSKECNSIKKEMKNKIVNLLKKKPQDDDSNNEEEIFPESSSESINKNKSSFDSKHDSKNEEIGSKYSCEEKSDNNNNKSCPARNTNIAKHDNNFEECNTEKTCYNIKKNIESDENLKKNKSHMSRREKTKESIKPHSKQSDRRRSQNEDDDSLNKTQKTKKIEENKKKSCACGGNKKDEHQNTSFFGKVTQNEEKNNNAEPPGTMNKFKNFFGDISNKVTGSPNNERSRSPFRDIFRRKHCEDKADMCEKLKKPKEENCGLQTCQANEDISEEISVVSLEKNPLPSPPKSPSFKIKAPSFLNRFMKKKQPPEENKIETKRQSRTSDAKRSSIEDKTVENKRKSSLPVNDQSTKHNTSKRNSILEDKNGRKIQSIDGTFNPVITSTPKRKQHSKTNEAQQTRPSTTINTTRKSTELQQIMAPRTSSAPVKTRPPRTSKGEEFEPPITSTPRKSKQKPSKKTKDDFASVDDYTTPLTYKSPNISNKNKTNDSLHQSKNQKSINKNDASTFYETAVDISTNNDTTIHKNKNSRNKTNPNENKSKNHEKSLKNDKKNKTEDLHKTIESKKANKSQNEKSDIQKNKKNPNKRKKGGSTYDFDIYSISFKEKKLNKKLENHQKKLSKVSDDSFRTATSGHSRKNNFPQKYNKNTKNNLKFGHIYSEEDFFGPTVKPNTSFCSCSSAEKFYVTTEISPNKKYITTRLNNTKNKNKSKTSLRSIYTHIDRTNKCMVTNEISPTKNSPKNCTKYNMHGTNGGANKNRYCNCDSCISVD